MSGTQWRAIGFLVSALLCSGCGGAQDSTGPQYTEAAEEAWMLAERQFLRNDYEGARLRYTDLYTQFPYSQYAALAELRVGDCYYGERSYELARSAYDRFVQFHPTHEEVPRAAFQVSMSYVKQVPGAFVLMPPNHERDLTQARNAYLALGSFLRAYPGSDHVADAEAELVRMQDVLVEHELYAAQWNLRHDNPLGAARRAMYVADTYPEATRMPDALFLFSRAMLEMGDVDQASAALRRLRDEYAGTEAGEAARGWLSEYGE